MNEVPVAGTGGAGGCSSCPLASFPVVVASFRLPWPPSVNVYWRTSMVTFGSRGGTPVVHLTKRARAFRREAWAEMLAQKVKPVRIAVPAFLSVGLAAPDRRRRDLDNVLKPILDVLVHAGLLEDDAVIRRLTVEDLGVDRGSGGYVRLVLSIKG